MDFGIFDFVEGKSGALVADLYKEHRALAKMAEQAGCYCYHVAEHHATPLSRTPSPNLLLAALAVETSRIHLAPLCVVLPLYEPLRLIEEICMLDNLSEGRLELGIGRGVSNIEMKFYNVSVDQSRARFDEALEVIKLGLTRPVLDHQGEFYDYDMVPMEMRPVQQPHPPFWYPTSNLQSVPWVAKNGFNTVFAGHLDHVAQQVASYREHSDPSIGGGGRKLGIHPFIVVAPTDGEALRVGEAAYAAHQANLSHLAKWKGRSAELTRVRNLPSLATLAEAIESGLAAAGSPGAVADQLAAIIDKTGCNYILYTPTSGDTPFAFATRALELFADKVLPALG